MPKSVSVTLTGKPGSGKTRVAEFLKDAFRLAGSPVYENPDGGFMVLYGGAEVHVRDSEAA